MSRLAWWTLAVMTFGSELGLVQPMAGAAAAEREEKPEMESQARAFLKEYLDQFAQLEIRANLAEWQAANSGQEKDFAAAAEAALAVSKYHSDPAAYQRVRQLRRAADGLSEVEKRSLELAELAYRRNQLPPDLLERMVTLSKEIERLFGTFRAEVDGQRLSNNDLLERLGKETDSPRRKTIWEGLKQVGPVVAGKLVELAELRNQAAAKLGFANFWEMQVRLQEHDPDQLLAIFDELERLTRQPFTAMKAELDAELARRFEIQPAEMMPWHYDNPFFQAAPPSEQVDLNEFYEKKSREADRRDRPRVLPTDRLAGRRHPPPQRPVRTRGQGPARVLHEHQSRRGRPHAVQHQAHGRVDGHDAARTGPRGLRRGDQPQPALQRPRAVPYVHDRGRGHAVRSLGQDPVVDGPLCRRRRGPRPRGGCGDPRAAPPRAADLRPLDAGHAALRESAVREPASRT